MPPEALLTLRQFLMASAPQTPDGKLSVTFRSDNAFLEIDLKGSEEPRATVLKIRREGSLYDFSFQDESDGTKQLSDLVDFLLMHSHEKAFVIDELSRSFHPMLTSLWPRRILGVASMLWYAATLNRTLSIRHRSS